MAGFQKNVAGQKWLVFAFNETDNTAKAGDAAQITGKIRKDHAGATAITDTNPTEIEDGYYEFDLTQAETNADILDILPESSTGNIQVIGCPARVFTVPPNFADMGIEADGHAHADVKQIEGADATDQIRDAVVDDATRIDASALNTLSGHDPAGQLASQSDVQGITQAQRVRVLPAPQMERPDSGSTAYRLWIYVYDEQHKAEDLDSNPTVTAENNAGTDPSASLGAVTKPGATTGIYYVDYTVADAHAVEGVVFKVAATEGAVTTNYAAPSVVVDTTAVDFTSADRTKLDGIYDKLPAGAISDFDEAGDKVDLVDAPNATAITAIQSGLALATALVTTDAVVDAIKAIADKLDSGLEADGGVFRLTQNMLEQAPGGAGVTVSAFAAAAIAQLFTLASGKSYADAIAQSLVKEIADNSSNVGTGNVTTITEATLDVDGTALGSVLDENDSPIAGATVGVYADADTECTALLYSGSSDGDGGYAISVAIGATYRIKVTYSGYTSNVVRVTV